MSTFPIRRSLLLMALLSAVLAGACSTPAVTGMKVHMQNQEYQDVVLLADSVIAMGDSLDPEVWFWRGSALTEMSQWSDAAESFWKAHEIGAPEDMAIDEYWFVFFNSAANTMNEGDVGTAVELLEKGMQLAPHRPDFQLMLGDVELNMNNDLQAALDNFQAAAGKAGTLVADIRTILEETSDPYELDYYSQNLQQAESIWIQSLFNSGTILRLMAMEAEGDQVSQYALQAEEAYMKALEVDPTNVDVLDALAGAYLIEEDYQSALEVYDQAMVNIDLGVSEGWLQPEGAEQLRANMLVSKGYALIEMEDYQQAVSVLEQARGIIGDDYIVLASMAHANFVMENYHEALADLEAVLMIDGLGPDELANTYYTTYACYNRLEMDEEAAESLETALQFDPDNADYWRYLASTYSRLGRRNEAIEAMERAEELEPGE
ncbi:MAG: hypothetical protein AVO35_03450 [Candidatus Aegiribacteria sp. MLS_C]|nr:MAG: hypothetical protein AVO35_03450 [Candidatus Aegiribacteria sp. MLS_C]